MDGQYEIEIGRKKIRFKVKKNIVYDFIRLTLFYVL